MGYWDKFKQSTGAKSGRESQAGFNAFERAVDHRELIKPVLHRWDKQDLWEYVKTSIEKEAHKNGKDDLKLDETKIPKFMVYDIYNKYFTQQRDMRVKKPNDKNQWLYDFLLNNLQNYYTKPITDNHGMNSAIYTSEIVYQLLLLNEQKNPSEQQGGGEGNSQMEHTLGQTGNHQLQDAIQKAESNAQSKIEDLENFQNELGGADEKGDDEGNQEGGKQAGTGSNFSINDAANLQHYFELLHGVNLKSTHLNNFIKDTLKFSTSYFSSQFKELEDSIFDSDDIAELMGIENLLPQLRNLHIDDVVTTKREYYMKFDVYIDMSGSMGGERANSQLTQAKVTALKLDKLGLVDKMYCFDTKVTPALSKLKMLKTNSGGGTSLENVVKQVKKLNRPSVIITDACDNVRSYTDKAYFIGVTGASFDGYFGHGDAATF